MEHRSVTQRVAAKVRGVMAESSVTQATLADRMGIPQQRLSRRLSARIAITVDEAYEIAAALGVEPSAILPTEVAA